MPAGMACDELDVTLGHTPGDAIAARWPDHAQHEDGQRHHIHVRMPHAAPSCPMLTCSMPAERMAL